MCLCVKGKIWGLAQYCTTVSIKYAHCTTFQHLHPTQQHTCCHTHTDTHSRSEKLGFTRTNTTDVERKIRQGGKMEGEAARETRKGINRKCWEAWECYKYVPSWGRLYTLNRKWELSDDYWRLWPVSVAGHEMQWETVGGKVKHTGEGKFYSFTLIYVQLYNT